MAEARNRDGGRKGKARVAIVVPAYNEESRIGSVLDTLTKINEVDEVVVVDDGSRDETARVARGRGVRVVERKENGGKGAAMMDGLAETDAEIVGFIDADLVNLTVGHVRDLVRPLLEDSGLSMSVGKFQGGRRRTDWAQRIVPSISGQRVVRRSFLTGAGDLSGSGFGVEALITRHAKRTGARVVEVRLDRATQVMKEEKLGFFKGFLQRLRMYKEIARTIISKDRLV